jgi:hypothetical protein
MTVVNKDYVTASELANFIYCECCWADKLEGIDEETVEMVKGTEEHIFLQRVTLLLLKLKQIVIYFLLILSAAAVAVFIYQLFGGTFS